MKRKLGLGFAVAIALAGCIRSAVNPVAPPELADYGQIRPTLFGAVWCPYCQAAKSWFDDHHIAYTDCDIETDTRCQKWYAILRDKNGVHGVPVFLYKNKVWNSFSEQQMQEIADAR
jgi:glutaredoxin